MTGNLLRDGIVAGIFGLLSLSAIFFLIPAGIDAPGSIENAALSPTFWPSLIAYATLIASGLLLVETALASRLSNAKSDAERDMTEATDNDEDDPFRHNALTASIRVAVALGLLFVFYLSLDRYGVVLPAIILLATLMIFYGERRLVLVSILSICIPLILYGFFRYVAGVAIPLGIFG